MRVRPIFVLGRHRSGTTWVSNVLAAFPDVYAPVHEAHHGIHESAFFSHLVPYCHEGRTSTDLLAIKHLFERSDYFLLTGLRAGPDILAHGYVEYFRLAMEAAARQKTARYWLEKTPAHTLLARFLAKSFPDAVFIAVVREARDVVASNVHGFGNPHSVGNWFWQAAVTAVYEKIIVQNNLFVIRYEDFKDRHDDTVRAIARRLELGDAQVPAPAFARNTSYREQTPSLTWWQRTAIVCGLLAVRIWPASWVEAAVNRWHARRSGVTLPKWFFLLGSRTTTSGKWQ
jgi:hypothetical protein